jgi:hypothetical protein
MSNESGLTLYFVNLETPFVEKNFKKHFCNKKELRNKKIKEIFK